MSKRFIRKPKVKKVRMPDGRIVKLVQKPPGVADAVKTIPVCPHLINWHPPLKVPDRKGND